MKCQYCEYHESQSYYYDKRICVNCYNAFCELHKTDLCVKKEDYLKVVEEKEYLHAEKENWRESFTMMRKENEKHVKELKEKEEEIERLKEIQKVLEWNNNELVKLTEYISKNIKGNAGRLTVDVAIEELERLKNLYEPEKQYEDWCELKYWYNNQTKMHRQHMNYEDACELIGMDSDNWDEFNVVKYKKEVK